MKRNVALSAALLLGGFFAGFATRYLIDVSSPPTKASFGASPSSTAPPQVRTEAAIEPKEFEAAYRAARAITSAIDVGVNYQKFSELVQNFALELSLANDNASSGEKDVIALYTQALSTCRDAQTLWGIELRDGQAYVSGSFGATLSYLKEYDGNAFKTVKELRKKYSLDIRGRGPNEVIMFDRSIQQVLNVASQQFVRANDAYRGK
jgi:hypothetical protein